MSDPAIEAAKRGAEVVRVGQGFFTFPGEHMEIAAREALAPLRDMHRPYATNDPRSPYDVVCNHCLGPKKWPCPTALYLYSTEELEQ